MCILWQLSFASDCQLPNKWKKTKWSGDTAKEFFGVSIPLTNLHKNWLMAIYYTNTTLLSTFTLNYLQTCQNIGGATIKPAKLWLKVCLLTNCMIFYPLIWYLSSWINNYFQWLHFKKLLSQDNLSLTNDAAWKSISFLKVDKGQAVWNINRHTHCIWSHCHFPHNVVPHNVSKCHPQCHLHPWCHLLQSLLSPISISLSDFSPHCPTLPAPIALPF